MAELTLPRPPNTNVRHKGARSALSNALSKAAAAAAATTEVVKTEPPMPSVLVKTPPPSPALPLEIAPTELPVTMTAITTTAAPVVVAAAVTTAKEDVVPATGPPVAPPPEPEIICTVCGEIITARDTHLAYRPCGHYVHLGCMYPFFEARRAACVTCHAHTAGTAFDDLGYLVDTGLDGEVSISLETLRGLRLQVQSECAHT